MELWWYTIRMIAFQKIKKWNCKSFEGEKICEAYRVYNACIARTEKPQQLLRAFWRRTFNLSQSHFCCCCCSRLRALSVSIWDTRQRFLGNIFFECNFCHLFTWLKKCLICRGRTPNHFKEEKKKKRNPSLHRRVQSFFCSLQYALDFWLHFMLLYAFDDYNYDFFFFFFFFLLSNHFHWLRMLPKQCNEWKKRAPNTMFKTLLFSEEQCSAVN